MNKDEYKKMRKLNSDDLQEAHSRISEIAECKFNGFSIDSILDHVKEALAAKDDYIKLLHARDVISQQRIKTLESE